MKKVLLTIALVAAAATSAFAQPTLGAGYVNNQATTTVGNSISTSTTNGFYVEGGYGIPLAGAFSVTPAIRYTFLGSSKDNGIVVFGQSLSGSSKLIEHYVGIPIMLDYGFDIGGVAKISLFAGPTFNYGVSSKLTTSASANILGISLGTGNSVSDLYDGGNYNRFDVLVGGGIGVEIENVGLKVGYHYGVLDRYASDNSSLHDAQLLIGATLKF